MRALAILAFAAACHHDSAAPGAAPIATADQDALWKLAPDPPSQPPEDEPDPVGAGVGTGAP